MFEELATSIALNKPVEDSEILPDLTGNKINLVLGAWPDRPKIGKQFGDMIRDIKATQRERAFATLYGMSGTTVSATFVAGNPRHDVKLEESFLTVEKKLPSGEWMAVRNDHDYDTR